MNIFHKVTLAALRKNKARTVITVIGVILSAAMICAVTTSVSSVLNYLVKNFSYTDGAWHGSVPQSDGETLDKLAENKEIDGFGYAQYIGYAKSKTETYTFCRYLYIVGAGGDYFELMPIHLITGRYPQKDGEILLSEDILRNHEVDYKVGDTLTLDVGVRILDGELLWQDTPYEEYPDLNGDWTSSSGETFEVRETKTYTIVGFCEEPDTIPFCAGHYGYTVADESLSEIGFPYDLVYSLKNPKNIYSFIEKNGLPSSINNDVLLFLGVSDHQGFYTMVYGLCAIVIGLIAFGAVSLIYNAFSISVSERTRQFGLLSSLGATKKQLRRMVLFEAFTVSIAGIPIGVLAGIGGIAVTLSLTESEFQNLIGLPLPLTTSVSISSVVAACVLSLITVLISAWIPSKRAMRVSAVEAIRQNADIKADKRISKTSKLTYKLFGLPGVLARKHFRRNRKKYRATVVSLFTSIVLFVSVSSFSQYLTEAVSGKLNDGFDLSYHGILPEKAEAISKELADTKGITAVAYADFRSRTLRIPKKSLNEQWTDWAEQHQILAVTADPEMAGLQVEICFVNDEVFLALLKENGLEEALYTDPANPLALVYDLETMYDRSKEKYYTLHVLESTFGEAEAGFSGHLSYEDRAFVEDFIDQDGKVMCRYIGLNDEEYIIPHSEGAVESFDKIIRYGERIDKLPFYMDFTNYVNLIYPCSAFDALKESDTDLFYPNLYIQAKNPSSMMETVKEVLVENGMSSDGLQLNSSNSRNRSINTVVKVFSYGFVILISLIAAANIFNTISTNISLRRRELAMLKSVGMTSRGFNRMLNYECLLYGAKALLFALPVSVGVTYLIYRANISGIAASFHLPWGAVLIATVSVFFVVGITMLYSMRKVKKSNPIDALKNENL